MFKYVTKFTWKILKTNGFVRINFQHLVGIQQSFWLFSFKLSIIERLINIPVRTNPNKEAELSLDIHENRPPWTNFRGRYSSRQTFNCARCCWDVQHITQSGGRTSICLLVSNNLLCPVLKWSVKAAINKIHEYYRFMINNICDHKDEKWKKLEEYKKNKGKDT